MFQLFSRLYSPGNSLSTIELKVQYMPSSLLRWRSTAEVTFKMAAYGEMNPKGLPIVEVNAKLW